MNMSNIKQWLKILVNKQKVNRQKVNRQKLNSQISSKQNGSALVESILIIGVLLIFMIGVPMIGSMIDLKQTTIQASRYSAWEKTVNVATDSVGAQLDQRFFRDASAPITSSVNGDIAPNMLWGELAQDTPTDGSPVSAGNGAAATSDQELQISQKGRVTLSQGSVVQSSEAGGNLRDNIDASWNGGVYRNVAKAVTTIGAFISPDGWDDGNPVSDGLVRSSVEATIDSNYLFTSSNSLKESTSILIDGWSAADSETIRDRVHGFVPTNRLERLGYYVSKLKYLPMLTDLKNLEDAFGCVKTNIIPGKTHADGLKTYDPVAKDNC